MKTKITEVTIIPIRPQNGLMALASCVVDDKLYISSIGIYTKLKGGFRLTYPNKKAGTNTINLYHPVNKECGDAIEEAIITEYQKLMKKDYE